MSKQTVLFNELNVTNHVCLHSAHPCKYCVSKILPIEEKSPRSHIIYIAPFEVVVHNSPHDIWVSFLGKVYDLTSLVQEFKHEKCIAPLIAFAGKDISHWFDEKTGDILHYVHPVTGALVPYCPHGAVPHVHAQVPHTNWCPIEDKPWWKDDRYLVGYLSKRVRPLRIMNMHSRDRCAINVCCEDTLDRIQERYLIFNNDADSYTWLYEDRVLDMNKTLEENGIPDERDKFTSIGLPENTYVPMMLLYYNDDLKWE